jgi:hypothetical protein
MVPELFGKVPEGYLKLRVRETSIRDTNLIEPTLFTYVSYESSPHLNMF